MLERVLPSVDAIVAAMAYLGVVEHLDLKRGARVKDPATEAPAQRNLQGRNVPERVSLRG